MISFVLSLSTVIGLIVLALLTLALITTVVDIRDSTSDGYIEDTPDTYYSIFKVLGFGFIKVCKGSTMDKKLETLYVNNAKRVVKQEYTYYIVTPFTTPLP